MKYVIILLLTLASLNIKAQVYNQAMNVNCGDAWFIHSNSGSISTSFVNQRNCTNSVDLYYYYRSSEDVNENIFSLSATNNGSNVSFNYIVYGPFANYDQSCNFMVGVGTQVTGNQNNPTVSHSLVQGQYYSLKVTVNSCSANFTLNVLSENLNLNNVTPDCLSCIKGFYPDPGMYVVSAWVRDNAQSTDRDDFVKPSVIVRTGPNTHNLIPAGQIIDGWQRLEATLKIEDLQFNPFSVELKCEDGGECYFDDIRIFPTDGTMVTYVYDPLTLRLSAELDENNYAKIYEYDEQGKLVRVKKETERGIMTIQETRENNAGHE